MRCRKPLTLDWLRPAPTQVAQAARVVGVDDLPLFAQAKPDELAAFGATQQRRINGIGTHGSSDRSRRPLQPPLW
jgi:hypothetical protein